MYINTWKCPYCKEENNYIYKPDTIQNENFVEVVKCDYCNKESAIDVTAGITITSVLNKETYNKIYNRIFNRKSLNKL